MTAEAPDRARSRLAVALTIIEPALRTLAAAVVVGIALGALIGGVGGRLAMRALFLTSDGRVRGVVSDDGFAIGRFTASGSFDLLLAGAFFGGIGALSYLAVRPFLIGPRWLRVLGCGGAAGVVVGASLVHRDGVDFTALGPVWFAIVLFVIIPTVFGLLAPLAIDRTTRPSGWFHTAPAWLALLPLVVFVLPPLPILLAAVAAGRLLWRSPGVAAVASHPVTMWTGRAGWLAIVALGSVDLARDARALL